MPEQQSKFQSDGKVDVGDELPLPPLPEPDGVISAMWACLHSGPNFDGRDKDVAAAARAYARRYASAAVARERERLADPLPAAVVKKIKDECSALGLDYVAFAWRIQKRLASAIRAR